MPTMLPGGYRSPYAQTIAELMMRQGDIAARSAERSGQIWGNAVQNLGQIGAQAYEQHQEQKIKQQRQQAFDAAISSWDGKDPVSLFKRTAAVVGPEAAAATVKAMSAFMQPHANEATFKDIVGGLAMAKAKLGEDYVAQHWSEYRPKLQQHADEFNGGIQLDEQYRPEYGAMIDQFHQQMTTPEKADNKVVGDALVGPDGKVIYKAEAKPEKGSAVGSFEDYLVRKFGPNPSPQQIESARRAYNQSDDRLPAAPTLTPNAEASVIDKLSRQYTAAAKPTAELSRQVKIMDAGLAEARKGNLAAGSQAVLVTFQKILDPLSVVRESEYARSAEGQSLIAQIQGFAERLARGGAGVPLKELENYARVARKLTEGQTGYLKAQRERIGKVADHYKIPRELVLDSYDFGGAVGGTAPALPAETQSAVDRLFGKK